MINKKKKVGIIIQVAILFAISILASGLFTFYTQLVISDSFVKRRTESLADRVADEVNFAVMEIPAHDWLLNYWYEHFDELEIEYDTDYEQSTLTREKCDLLNSHCPTLLLKYASPEQIEALSPEDQKLYAEITYSWLITRVNQIKRSHNVDYLFCVSTDNTYREQFFLFSAAEEGDVRGTNYEEAYTLGTQVKVSKSQQDAMRSAKQHYDYLADAGKYVDYYSYLTTINNRPLFIGMTYDLTVLKQNIKFPDDQQDSLCSLLSVLPVCHLSGFDRIFYHPAAQGRAGGHPFLQGHQEEQRRYREPLENKVPQ